MKLGKYKHYKGNEYQVIAIAKDSETLEDIVVYRANYETQALWVRPLKMFHESVVFEGKRHPRFEFIS